MTETQGKITNTNHLYTILLPALLISGAAIGFLIGGLFGDLWTTNSAPAFTGFMKLLGDLFMNLLKMVVIPLIVCSMIVGMASLSEQKQVGKIFGVTFAYYVLTTIFAVIIGLILVSTIQPGIGTGIDHASAPAVRQSLAWYDALYDMIRSLVPNNLFKAAASGQILGLLVFSLIFGGMLNLFGERGKQIVELTRTVNDVLMLFVRAVIWAAPIGIIGLVSDRVGQAGGGEAVWIELVRLSRYFMTVVLGLTIHGFIVLPALLFILAKRNPIQHFGHFAEALFTAFSTASSAATLPITIRDARQNAKLSAESSHFVLPLGATINMDGTALYEAVAAVFIAQAYGIDLSGAQLIIVLLTATLAAVGAAAIPQAGLVTMVMVLTAVNVPVEGIGILLSIDWLLDRFRTAINVWGDSIGTAIVDLRFAQHFQSSDDASKD